jgi:integrase
MPLTDVSCRATKPGPKRRKLSDGRGLQLWIMPSGSRLWRLVYRCLGKQRALALGTYPEISLIEARGQREAARLLLRSGKDPILERERERRLTQDKLSARDSFSKVASELMAKYRREQFSEITLLKKEWLLAMAMPKLGNIPVSKIRPLDVLEVLQKVEARGKYETARRLRSTIGSVCRYAIITARAENDPTIVLRGAITTPKVKSYAAITDPERFGELLRSIDEFNGLPQTVAGLKLLALLFPRPGELRLAEWQEFDFNKCVWTIPAEKTKMRRTHHVPLAPQAIGILTGLKEHTGHRKYAFSGLPGNKDQPLCENALNVALRRMGFGKDEMTSHGFRSSASSLLNESDKWNPDAIERQLAHLDGNPVRRIYARNSMWEQRAQMMKWWADYLDELRSGTVTENSALRSNISTRSRPSSYGR